MHKAIVIICGVVASLVPLVIVIGKLFTGIGAIIKIAPMLGTAFTFLTGPVGLVVAAIAAAIAIGVALYKNWDKIKAAASVLLNAITNVFAKIKTAITGPMAAARDFVKKVIDKIKSFFNFKVKLPHIKLPHFSIRPRGWKLGDLLEGSIPHLGIEWYAKGGIFNSPSVIGVGEKGPEAVLPIEKLQGMMATMADDIVNGMTTGMRLAGTGEQTVLESGEKINAVIGDGAGVLSLTAIVCSIVFMLLLVFINKKLQWKWLESFAMPLAMILSMVVIVLLNTYAPSLAAIEWRY